MLIASGLPFVIENVVGAPINASVMLCGTMFGLRIQKHRLFETNWPLPALVPAACDHSDTYNPWQGAGRTAAKMREAQDTPWIPMAGGMSRKAGVTGDLYNAIPPAYTEWIGRHLLDVLASPKADPVRPAWGRADVGRPSGTRERPSPSSGGGSGRRAPRRRRAGSTPSRPATP
jgi:DNA (cytosine-5)-methyltransferase 1